jgi:hypothetical protein
MIKSAHESLISSPLIRRALNEDQSVNFVHAPRLEECESQDLFSRLRRIMVAQCLSIRKNKQNKIHGHVHLLAGFTGAGRITPE